MKKYYLVLALAASGLMSCEKLEHLGDISRDFTYTETVEMPEVPGLPDIDTLPEGGFTGYAPTMAMATNSKQYVGESGSTPDLVKHAKMTKLLASILQPTGANFDFMDTVRMFVSAEGLEEKLIAYKYGIPKGTQQLDLDVDSVNLKQYFLKDSMYIRFGGHFIGVPDSNTKVELKTTFNMLANPLKKN
ncbi:hypothetical protein [Polluticoccus soli]|uniref:hypothetical protein n=1 Tax=Polluticoccus soli TaxID=3034150 RepID=UPI0023E0E4D0|nr:hypothetical protein [Flavipsychrobacter sp. JY13-12]